LLILTRLALEAPAEKDPPWVRLSFAPAFILILLSVLITGSRAGFIAALAALSASSCMIWPAMRQSLAAEGRKRHKSMWRSPAVLALGGCAMAILLVVLAFIWFERAPAMGDILERNSFGDLRWSILPILTSMACEHLLVGTGFGSFDAVYRLYEPTALLLPAYVNHAHNDWLQLVIEGGLPSIVIFSGLLVWILRALASVGRGTPLRRERLIFWVACLAIVAAASLVDYPLRTPLFQAMGVWLLICLSWDRANAPSN
jgi:O-antigen ligase